MHRGLRLVSRRTGKSVLLVAILAAMSGCSVLGIATKGDLEKQEARSTARDAELTARAETLREELGEIARALGSHRESLNVRLASLEAELGELDAVRGELTAIGKRLDVARQELTILDGKLARDLGVIRGEVGTASARAEEAHELAELGESRGQHVMDAQLSSLRSERRLLRQQLDEVESLLAEMSEWEATAVGERENALREVQTKTLP